MMGDVGRLLAVEQYVLVSPDLVAGWKHFPRCPADKVTDRPRARKGVLLSALSVRVFTCTGAATC